MDKSQIGEVGESPPPVHPISIPEQDEIKPLHLFRCRRNPKKEGTVFINKTYHKATGERFPPPLSRVEVSTQRKKPPEHNPISKGGVEDDI